MNRNCSVAIEGTSRTFECGDEYVLDAAIAAGLKVPYNCRGGACGTCKAEVLEGAVEHGWVMGFAITDEELSQGKCLICSSKPKTARLRLRMINHIPQESPARACIPAEYPALVVAAHNLTPTVRMLTVRMPSAPPFTFDAGMYMEIHLDGVEPPRPYSIATAPAADGTAPDGMISFLVARHEYGMASSRLHDATCAGDTLRLRGPYGTFRLPMSRKGPTLLLGGGTGLAPLISLATESLQSGHCGTIELWFSIRTRHDLFYAEQLQRLASRYADFTYRVFFTRADPAEALPEHWYAGRVTQRPPDRDELARAECILIAGSPSFVEACRGWALRNGAGAAAVLTEAYEHKIPRGQIP